MFVYLKEPMGCTTLDGKTLCGKYYARGSFGPTSVTRDFFHKNKDRLEEFEFTSEWLSRKFSKQFPAVSFTPTTFWLIDFKTVIDIARLVGIDYVSKGNREYSDIEKRALRRSILSKIEGVE